MFSVNSYFVLHKAYAQLNQNATIWIGADYGEYSSKVSRKVPSSFVGLHTRIIPILIDDLTVAGKHVVEHTRVFDLIAKYKLRVQSNHPIAFQFKIEK